MSRHLVSHGRARLPPGSPVASDQLEDGSRRSWIAGVMRAAGGRAQERRSMEFEASRLAAVGGDRAQAIADLQQANMLHGSDLSQLAKQVLSRSHL